MAYSNILSLQKFSLEHDALKKDIEHVIELLKFIDLSSPISAKLMLLATSIEIATLCDNLQGCISVLEEYYIPSLAKKPTFDVLGHYLSKAVEELYESEDAYYYRDYYGIKSLTKGERPNFYGKADINAIERSAECAIEVFNKMKEYCEDGIYISDIHILMSKVESFFDTPITDMINLIYYQRQRFCEICDIMAQMIQAPTFKSVKNGLELITDEFLGSNFQKIIKDFNIEKEHALDEFDEDTSEKITEGIKYLQEKKRDIHENSNKYFFNLWIDNMNSKTKKVNFEAVINEFHPQIGVYNDDILNEEKIISNLKDIYMYDYITSEIKRQKEILRKMQEPQKAVKYDSHDLSMGDAKLKSFPNDNKFVRDKVKEIITEFYDGSYVSLALIEIAFFYHNYIDKINQHTTFLKDLRELKLIVATDKDIAKIANAMADKMKHLPKTTYTEWDDIYRNEIKKCSDIGKKLCSDI